MSLWGRSECQACGDRYNRTEREARERQRETRAMKRAGTEQGQDLGPDAAFKRHRTEPPGRFLTSRDHECEPDAGHSVASTSFGDAFHGDEPRAAASTREIGTPELNMNLLRNLCERGQLTGARIAVWWPADHLWHTGHVLRCAAAGVHGEGSVEILYGDGVKTIEALRDDLRVKIIPGALEPERQVAERGGTNGGAAAAAPDGNSPSMLDILQAAASTDEEDNDSSGTLSLQNSGGGITSEEEDVRFDDEVASTLMSVFSPQGGAAAAVTPAAGLGADAAAASQKAAASREAVASAQLLQAAQAHHPIRRTSQQDQQLPLQAKRSFPSDPARTHTHTHTSKQSPGPLRGFPQRQRVDDPVSRPWSQHELEQVAALISQVRCCAANLLDFY